MQQLPSSLQARSDRDAIWEDLAPYRGMSEVELARAVSQLCRWARDAIEASADPDAAWRWEDKRSPASLALWKKLMARKT